MLSPLSLELFAADLQHDRDTAVAHAALLAQLPHAAAVPPDLAARQRFASGLYALALRLDPCAGSEPSSAAMTSR